MFWHFGSAAAEHLGRKLPKTTFLSREDAYPRMPECGGRMIVTGNKEPPIPIRTPIQICCR